MTLQNLYEGALLLYGFQLIGIANRYQLETLLDKAS
jgi:hypothetical protein